MNEGFNCKEIIGVACGGFDLLVIDDSGRHFAGAQELIQLSISGILYKSQKCPNTDNLPFEMKLQLNDIELADCLQSLHSPFRTVAVGNHVNKDQYKVSKLTNDGKEQRWQNMNKTIFTDFMTWENYAMVQSSKWGYDLSPNLQTRSKIAMESTMRQPFDDFNLIEFHQIISATHDHTYKLCVREVALHWNPSMAIALQRFLGRLKKRAKEKEVMSHWKMQSDNSHHVVSQTGVLTRSKTAECQIDALTLCLNKEHQHRRLLQVTTSNLFMSFHIDELGRSQVSGRLGDFNAWDSDGNRKGQIPICHHNRFVVGMLHRPDGNVQEKSSETVTLHSTNSQGLLVFKYYSNSINKSNSNDFNQSSVELPDWVRKLVDQDATVNSVDDFLFLTVATLRFTHLKERTGEILDYLSNGLPGKGMGATSRAAKGFISKRIRTRSFATILIDAPQVFLPRHRGNQNGFVMCLGDVNLNSWFNESTIEEIRNNTFDHIVKIEISNNHKVPPNINIDSADSRYWWRVLSISIIGFGWQVSKENNEVLSNSLHIESPVNVHLQVQKPLLEENLPTIVHCKMTALEFILRYSEYILLRAVLKENLGKKLDKSLWDNPEDTFLSDEDLSSAVRYSEIARFVRYGVMPKSDKTVTEYQEEKKPKTDAQERTSEESAALAQEALNDLLTGKDVHGGALHLVGRWVAKGLSNAEIHAIMGSISDQVASARGAKRAQELVGEELDRLIDGARAKGYTPYEADLSVLLESLRSGAPEIQDESRPRTPTNKQEQAVPEHLLRIPGVLGLGVNWMLDNSKKPQPIYAVQTMIALGATVLGRRYCTDHQNWPSLFLPVLGLSATGKESIKSSIERVLNESGLSKLIGPSRYTSDSGLISSLIHKPSHLCVSDEVGKVLSAAAEPNNSNARTMLRQMMEVWGRCDDTVQPIGYATAGLTKEAADHLNGRLIHKPALTFVGLSTPDTFYEALTRSSLIDGFINRMLIVECREMRKPSVFKPKTDVPGELVNWCQNKFNQGITINGQFIQIDDVADQEPSNVVVIPFSGEAMARVRAFDAWCIEQQNELQSEGMAEMYGRTNEIAMRLSLIVAVSCGSERIELEHLDWAISYVAYWTREMVEQARFRVSDGVMDAAMKDVERLLMKAGDSGLSLRDLRKRSRRMAALPLRGQIDVLQMLKADQIIEMRQVKTRTKPRDTWFYVGEGA
jgi:hypothetical protein